MLATARRRGVGPDRLRQPRRRPGRARLRRRVAALRRARRAPRPGASSSPKTCSSSISTCAPHLGRRRVALSSGVRRADRPAAAVEPRIEPTLAPVHEVYEALVLGTRDYVRKNGFTDVLIALSGGVDSALVAAIAVDALGSEHVVGVLMPSRYSSDHSISDAELAGAQSRDPHVHRADRARARRVRAHARTDLRGTRRRTSPKRTCRRASAAT